MQRPFSSSGHGAYEKLKDKKNEWRDLMYDEVEEVGGGGADCGQPFRSDEELLPFLVRALGDG